MRFFEQQRQARAQTVRLLLLFALTLLVLVGRRQRRFGTDLARGGLAGCGLPDLLFPHQYRHDAAVCAGRLGD